MDPISQPWAHRQPARVDGAHVLETFERFAEQANAAAVFRHFLLRDFIESARAVKEHRDCIAWIEENFARKQGRAHLGVTLHIAVEKATKAMTAVQIADYHAINVDEMIVVLAEPDEVGTHVRRVLAQGDQKPGQPPVDHGHAKIIRTLVKMPQGGGIERQDRGTGTVVEGKHGIQVVLTDITKFNGHCNSICCAPGCGQQGGSPNYAMWRFQGHSREGLARPANDCCRSTRRDTGHSMAAGFDRTGTVSQRWQRRAVNAVRKTSLGSARFSGSATAWTPFLSYHPPVSRHALTHIRLLRYAGLFTYACVGVPLVSRDWMLARLGGSQVQDQLDQLQQQVRTHTDVLLWAASYVVFGLVYWMLTRNLGSHRHWMLKLVGLLVLTGAAIAIGWFSQSGLCALLLMVVCMVLPWTLPLPVGVTWLVLQNLALVPVFASFPRFDVGLAVLQVSLYLGFSAMVFVTSMVASQQAEAREEQRRLNSELRATRALLAETSRISERMRIARELHDLVGHHLTALSLNLEVASHLVNEPAAEHVDKAKATAKQLLTDVREVVSELRDDDVIDLSGALRSLTEGVPGLNVHLELPPRFAVDDPRRAQVLLRCTQEIVTNAARHAGARHLWLRFESTPDGRLALKAHDDGRGATAVTPGNGLAGMRERLAELGGDLVIQTARDRGFTLEASLPLETVA